MTVYRSICRWPAARRAALAWIAVAAAAALRPGAARAATTLEAGLMTQAKRQGAVRVIVQLEVPGAASAFSGDVTAHRQVIEGAQAALQSELAGLGAHAVRAFKTVPFVAMQVTPEALAALEASGAVHGVIEDRLEHTMLPESGPLVQADQAWAAGFDGSGWTIAIIDTGVDANHPFLSGKVVKEACFSANGSCPNHQTTEYGTGSAVPCDFDSGACLHGTHVAGIAAGRGDSFSGIARGASVIAIQVFSRFDDKATCGNGDTPCARTYTSDVMAALEYVYELRTQFNIAAANLSLGGGKYVSQASCDSSDAGRKAAIDNLRAAGIATVAAAGNDSYIDALGAPACISSAISVGATTKGDTIASFSNSASFLSLLAPGVSILSSVPPDGFEHISGTSQATPHVSGAIAILDQKLGAGDVDLALSTLQATGLPLLDPRNALTKSRIRILDALVALPSSGSPSGLQITPDDKRTLVNKDVNGQRWAITLNHDDGTVTGNVFSPAGGDPQFVWCRQTGSDGNPDPYARNVTFSCSGADRCQGLSCPTDEWSIIASVTLQGAFFLPPLNGAASSSGGALGNAASDVRSGLQVTPDEKHTLVSKDVAGQRWAITQNNDDGTVTGNVFSPGGGDPQFLWCTRTGDNDDPDPYTVLVTYACSGAARCESTSCPQDGAWTFISNVTLPGAFFLPQ